MRSQTTKRTYATPRHHRHLQDEIRHIMSLLERVRKTLRQAHRLVARETSRGVNRAAEARRRGYWRPRPHGTGI